MQIRPARRAITRLPHHDYRQAGTYFFTLCTKRRVPALGCLEGGSVTLNPLGQVVDHCWREIEVIRPWIVVDEFVVMPDHLHGLLQIWRGEIGSVISAVQQFKGAVSRAAGAQEIWKGPLWQRGFHEAVLEGAETIGRVRRYIRANPEEAAKAMGTLPYDPDFR